MKPKHKVGDVLIFAANIGKVTEIIEGSGGQYSYVFDGIDQPIPEEIVFDNLQDNLRAITVMVAQSTAEAYHEGLIDKDELVVMLGTRSEEA